ncbi:hypothetical protein PR202_ga10196 [Eleusine coracana subsp. coracana]|uniref:non-specific serine/threonine protein kinase n=1 Tax=Eleusine coracana subsp. coracana TaxID=191504 RepID=A0AAV5C635_ELECO|nr:hypothetical protein PR202_ga10196 [Eleusine coracana subsp. coracana]
MAALFYLLALPLLSFQFCSCALSWRIMTTGSHIRAEDHEKIFLLSPDTTFSCGFHELGTNAFTFSIWYTYTNNRTVVWTANPYSPKGGYSPVNKYGSRISLNRDGNLILTDTNGSTVWESKTSSGKGTTVTLLNSGNLVINDSSNNIVWQSFHSPTDTLLPGQNLTKDTRFNSTRIAVLDDMGNFVSSDGFKIQASDLGPGIKRRITMDYDAAPVYLSHTRVGMVGVTQKEAKQILATGNVSDIVDNRLHGHFKPEQAIAMVSVALSCLEERSKRPTMDEIVKTISTGSSLKVDHGKTFLISPDTTFSCGFYSSGAGTNAYYFSIWFTHAADKTVVWTANPGSPVNGHGSEISFTPDGNFILTDVNGSTVWESRTSWGKSTTAALLNNGNLVIRDSSDSDKEWQSFDSPTDTLLPSQRLTRETKLVSQSGNHRLYFDNDNVLRLLYNGADITSIYWPSPDYNALQNGRTRFNSSKIAVLDDEGNFLSSDGFKMTASDSGFGVKRRITIDSDGNFRMYSLNASNGNWTVTGEAVLQMCYVHGLCGKNGICEYSKGFRCICPPGYEMADRMNWSKGCRPRFKINCGNPQDFTFIKIPHGDFYGFDLTSNKSISFEECKQICLDRCLCSSFTYKAGEGLCYTKELLYNGQVYPYFPGNNYIKLPKKKLAQEDDMDIVDARLKGRFNQEQVTVMVKIAVSCLEERSKRPTMDQIAKDLMAYDDDEDIHPAYF